MDSRTNELAIITIENIRRRPLTLSVVNYTGLLRCSKLPVQHEVFKGIFGEVAAMNQVGTHRKDIG